MLKLKTPMALLFNSNLNQHYYYPLGIYPLEIIVIVIMVIIAIAIVHIIFAF